MREDSIAWLLSLGWDQFVPLDWLFPTVLESGLNARTPLGLLAPAERVDALLFLAAEGWIEFDLGHEQQAWAALPDEALRSRLRTASPTPRDAYRLTPAGGAVWEQLTQPRWEEFIGERSDLDEMEVYGRNRDRLMAYVGWLPMLRGVVPLIETLVWNTYDSCNVTYWKELPQVHHVHFQVSYDPSQRCLPEPAWLRTWSESILKWATKHTDFC